MDSLARKAAQQFERERCEKWCPITITDPEKAPRADALKQAYWTSWQACAESYGPMREALQATSNALLEAETQFVGLAAYLATCNTDVIVENLETTIAMLHKSEKSAKAAVARAAEVLKGQ